MKRSMMNKVLNVFNDRYMNNALPFLANNNRKDNMHIEDTHKAYKTAYEIYNSIYKDRYYSLNNSYINYVYGLNLHIYQNYSMHIKIGGIIGTGQPNITSSILFVPYNADSYNIMHTGIANDTNRRFRNMFSSHAHCDFTVNIAYDYTNYNRHKMIISATRVLQKGDYVITLIPNNCYSKSKSDYLRKNDICLIDLKDKPANNKNVIKNNISRSIVLEKKYSPLLITSLVVDVCPNTLTEQMANEAFEEFEKRMEHDCLLLDDPLFVNKAVKSLQMRVCKLYKKAKEISNHDHLNHKLDYNSDSIMNNDLKALEFIMGSEMVKKYHTERLLESL